MPADVAALVDSVRPAGGGDRVGLQLVNLHAGATREVIVQAGAFGEHRFTEVRVSGRAVKVDRKFFLVRLPPGAVGRLELGMERFVNRPGYAFPWHGQEIPIRWFAGSCHPASIFPATARGAPYSGVAGRVHVPVPSR